MPILILGADTNSYEPIITIIRTNGTYKSLGYNKEVTTDGANWHIAVSQYSTVMIIAPRGSNIELSNEQL